MTSPTTDYREMLDKLKDIHKGFLEKYSTYVEKNLNEKTFRQAMVTAKLSLVARALREAGVVKDYVEIDAMGSQGSIVLTPMLDASPVLMINNVTEVRVLSNGFVGKDAFSQVLVWMPNLESADQQITFRDVLSDAFDWGKFAEDVMNIIHEAVYSKENAISDLLQYGNSGSDGKSNHKG